MWRGRLWPVGTAVEVVHIIAWGTALQRLGRRSGMAKVAPLGRNQKPRREPA
jgi:hypothetical protein